jgi:small conductance mechanosensitive channel
MKRFLQCAILAAGLALVWVPMGVAAADAPNEHITVAELEDLVAAIEDDQERQQLVQRLRALIELKKAEAGAPEPRDRTLGALLADKFSAYSEELGRQLNATASAILGIPRMLADLRNGLFDPRIRERWLVGLLSFIAVVAAGLVAARLVRRLLKRPLASLSQRSGDGILVLVPLLLARLVLILVPPLAFVAAGWAAVSLFEAGSVARPVALSIIYAVALAGAVNAVARTVLAPGATAVRPLRIADETAEYLYIWVRRIIDLGVYGYFTVEVAGLLGLPVPAQAFLIKTVGLALALFAIMMILQNRQTIASFIGGTGDGRLATLRRRLADLWHVLAILYVAAVYLVWIVGVPGGFTYMIRATMFSILSVAAALFVLHFVLRGVERAFSLSEEVKARLPGIETRVNRYLPVLKTTLHGLAWLIAALAVLQAWGVDILLWLGEPSGRALLGRVAGIGAIILLALVGWEAMSAFVERYLASEDAARSQRIRTLLPLLRKVILVVLVVMVGLTILSEFGINIAPLLAGAGVVGLAIGFGAQTLVRDVITGLFILLEDSVSVGDYVTLAGHGGTVEALSIRSIRLRDPSGTVYTVPFSDVTTVINYTREFAYAVLDIGVAYKEDVDAVSRVIEEVGSELRQDPVLAESILDDLQLQGLNQFADSAIVIRARIKTAPGMQWAVRRAFNRLLKRRFDAEGIEIPFPQRTVWFAEEHAADDEKAKLKDRASGSPATASYGGAGADADVDEES